MSLVFFMMRYRHSILWIIIVILLFITIFILGLFNDGSQNKTPRNNYYWRLICF